MSGSIVWRVRIAAPIERVYDALATDAGRATFWAESAVETNRVIHFRFPDGSESASKIIAADRPFIFFIEYFDSAVTFNLTAVGDATDVQLVNDGVPDEDRLEVIAGWVSVLLQLKAAVQFGVDLRNHNPKLSWKAGYVEN